MDNGQWKIMKKYIFISLLCAATWCFTACKQEVPWEQKHVRTLDLNVFTDDWMFDTVAKQFYYSFDVPEIDAGVYNFGNWTICREFNGGSKYAYQVALPTSMFMTDTLVDGTVAYYTQYIDYRVGIGYVDVQLTNSDYYYEVDGKGNIVNPESMLFRLQLIY